MSVVFPEKVGAGEGGGDNVNFADFKVLIHHIQLVFVVSFFCVCAFLFIYFNFNLFYFFANMVPDR